LDGSQILWNEDEDESEEFTKLNGPLVPHYHRRFTVHFAKNSSGYEPTIVCYIPKDSRLQVMDIPPESDINLVLSINHGTVRYMYVCQIKRSIPSFNSRTIRV
jgi:hypothetical protein